MAKFPSYPTLFDECKTISISDFRKWGYLKSNQILNGVITWSRNGNKTGSISISVNTFVESPFVELNYNCNGTPIKYKVPLIDVDSNLGKGLVWFFVCPHTGKRCRKLHLVGNYFYHRSAFRNCMYETQTKSHKSRNFTSLFVKSFGASDSYDKICSKNFKQYYNGQPTKRYIKAMKRIKIGGSISMEELVFS